MAFSIDLYEGPVQFTGGKGSGSSGSLKNAHVKVTEELSLLSIILLLVIVIAWIGSGIKERRR